MTLAVSAELATTIRTPAKVERIRIGSRDQWLKLRRQDITASVAAALLGIHPYTTAFQLWALKTGRVSEDTEETPPMRRGRLLEPVAVQILREEHPDWQFSDYPVGLYFRDPATRLGATPDLLAHDPERKSTVIQIKNVEPGVFRRDWKRDDGTIEPPLWIAIQALVETHLTGFERAAVAPMVVGHGVDLPLIPIPLHEGIIERIKREVELFWQLLRDGRSPDPEFGRDAALIGKLYSPDGNTVDLSADNETPALIARKEQLAAQKSAIDDEQAEIKGRLLTKLGGASAGKLIDGRFLTAKRINRKEFTTPATSYVDLRVKKSA